LQGGRIQGAGGAGGRWGGSNDTGQAGGTALWTRAPIQLDDAAGMIAGGGGGGGRGRGDKSQRQVGQRR
jgi:hypothetical protein